MQFDLAEMQLQRVAGNVEEIIGCVGESHVKLTARWRRRAK